MAKTEDRLVQMIEAVGEMWDNSHLSDVPEKDLIDIVKTYNDLYKTITTLIGWQQSEPTLAGWQVVEQIES